MQIHPSRLNRVYPWRPGLIPASRRFLQFERFKESSLPTQTDFRATYPGVWDQLDIGTCADNATLARVMQICKIMGYRSNFMPSRLFAYWNARGYEKTQDQDSGSSIHDAIQALHDFGVCPESEGDGTNPNWLWPYGDAASKLLLQKPDDACYKDAILHRSLKDASVAQDRESVLTLIAQNVQIVFGFKVHQSFEDDDVIKTGITKTPHFLEGVLGGHGNVTAGYALNTPMGDQGIKDWVLVRNSWGDKIYTDNPLKGNLAGYYFMPLDDIFCNPSQASEHSVIYDVGYKKAA